MSSKHKPYEMVGRSSIYSAGPASAKTRSIKFTAAMVASLIALYFLHVVFSPTDNVYGVIIDAGSTGSRVHTFTFRKNAETSDLKVMSEDFYAIKPGLSHYKENAMDAANSLESLLERAKTIVPPDRRERTPIVLRATAGLRMAGESVANEILTKVRAKLDATSFRFDSDWASILSGNEEAVYSWMTVNYLLGKESNNTVGVLEMGGGSAQVAYVPRDGSIKANLGSKCQMSSENLKFANSPLDLYTVSHLDFGLQKARALILRHFEKADKLSNNPCMNQGKAVQVPVAFEAPNASVSLTGSGNYNECRKMVSNLLIKPALGECSCSTCTYHGKAQPKAISEYIALAFYRERTAAIGMATTMTLADIDAKGRLVCAMPVDAVNTKFTQVPNGVATDLCLDLAFISLHLQHGHGIQPDSATKLIVVDKIDDFELGWCLGAMQNAMSRLYPKVVV